jgi:N-acetylglucosamine-6-sulfatase
MLRRLAAVALALVLAAAVAPAAGAAPPNVVFVLTDDLAWNLVQYMPHVQELQQRGMTFTRYYVTDSLCCPSRSSLFSGRFPHNTKIFTNNPPDGGFEEFHARGEEGSTFATDLQAAGYRTGMMGKYLNGYFPDRPIDGQVQYVPPGWTEWDVAGNGYGGFNYILNQNGQNVRYGNRPPDYLTDVVGGRAVQFINGAADAGQPFALEVATFAPHAPYTPAPRDANKFPGLTAPRTPAFDYANTDPPRWLSGHAPLRPMQVNNIDRDFRKRAQAVQAVDTMIANIESTLKARGLADNTYIVFSSDNGYHMGEHRLTSGKMTAFDTDIKVPLIVAGPGVPAGVTTTRIAENVDLRPTFDEWAGVPVPRSADGHSLAGLLRGEKPSDWRRSALIEHHGPDILAGDPDLPRPGSGNPNSYFAIRTGDAVYVEYRSGQREYYDLRRDKNELHNTYAKLGHADRSNLHAALTASRRCHGGGDCSAAQRRSP